MQCAEISIDNMISDSWNIVLSHAKLPYVLSTSAEKHAPSSTLFVTDTDETV